MPIRYWTAAAGLVVLAVVAAVWFDQGAPQPAPLLIDTASETRAVMTVHVSGAVASPGLVVVSEAARVADAIAAAGGSSRDADLSQVNLAAAVRDGEQIVVPSRTTHDGGQTAIAADGRVRINQATAADLEALPGVGPVLAERIVAFRNENGAFSVVEDLLDVPGIGEAKLAGMRDVVAVP